MEEKSWPANFHRESRGEKLIGRLKSLDLDSALLEVKSGEVSILFSEIKRATVEIEFNRKDGDKR
jgi:hypothetical protein